MAEIGGRSVEIAVFAAILGFLIGGSVAQKLLTRDEARRAASYHLQRCCIG
jgi:hypothetical protein